MLDFFVKTNVNMQMCFVCSLLGLWLFYVSALQGLNGIPPIPNGYNPATWVLEVTTPATEEKLNVDFADLYKNSDQYRCF